MNKATTVEWEWKMQSGRKWRGTFKAFVPVPYVEKDASGANTAEFDQFINAVGAYLVRIVRFDSLRRGKMIDPSKVEIVLSKIEPYGGDVVAG